MGIDCSGFVQVVYKANGISLPRDTRQQVNEGTDVAYGALQTGDLVFFFRNGAHHVGIYIGGKKIRFFYLCVDLPYSDARSSSAGGQVGL